MPGGLEIIPEQERIVSTPIQAPLPHAVSVTPMQPPRDDNDVEEAPEPDLITPSAPRIATAHIHGGRGQETPNNRGQDGDDGNRETGDEGDAQEEDDAPAYTPREENEGVEAAVADAAMETPNHQQPRVLEETPGRQGDVIGEQEHGNAAPDHTMILQGDEQIQAAA